MKKTLIVLFSLAIILFSGTWLTLKFIIPSDKISDFVISKISNSINREIAVKNASIGFFSLNMNDLKVFEKESKNVFVSCEKLSLKISPMALIKGEIRVKSMVLVSPTVDIKHLENGKYNFSDMLGKNKTKSFPVCTLSKSDDSFKIAFQNLSIKNGKVSIKDNSLKNTIGADSIDADNINGVLSFLDNELISEGEFSLFSNNIKFNSTYNVANGDSLLKLKSNGIKLLGCFDGDVAGAKAYKSFCQNVCVIDNLLSFDSGIDFTDYLVQEDLNNEL